MTYPEHIKWIIDNIGEALTRTLSQDNSYKTIDNPLSVFLDADPTSKKKLTQWLVDTYISGGFRWEDIQSGSKSKVFDTLSLYIKHKSKLDSDNHIAQYDTLGSVYKDIAPFIKSEKSGRSVKRDEQAQAYEESDILIKSESLTVVIPKTEYASKWWGKGTQWCTAGDKNNIFHDYFKNGPLIIIIVNGIKTQLHIDFINKDHSFSFMDEHDDFVNSKFVKDNWNILKPIMEWVIKRDIINLDYIPEHLITSELCLKGVKQCGIALLYVPKPLITPELCMEAVGQCGIYLNYVPEYLRTHELCLKAVKQNSLALQYVPENFFTSELCLDSVMQNGYSLRYIPEYFKTEELCLKAVEMVGVSLEYVPKDLITSDLCLKAVMQNGFTLFHVPKDLITSEICLEAVRQNGNVLHNVPQHLRTRELCLEAVKQNGGALDHVPEPLRTAELCLEAVRQCGGTLRHVSEPLRTVELCMEAIKNSGLALAHVPENLKTAKLCMDAVRRDGCALCFVPKSLITEEICLDAIKNDGRALIFIPELLKTEEICLEVFNKNRLTLSHIPEHYAKKFSEMSERLWDFNILDELKLEIKNSNPLNFDSPFQNFIL